MRSGCGRHFGRPRPRTRMGAATARLRGGVCVRDREGFYSSLFSLRFPQCVSFRSGLNTRSTWRFKARSMPMRACIRKSRPSAVPIRQPVAVCHSDGPAPPRRSAADEFTHGALLCV